MTIELAGEAGKEMVVERLPISFVVPTRNEERNIEATLESMRGCAGELVVLDSFSGDRTVDLAKALGAVVVQRRFDNFAAQKNWVLDSFAFRHEWVFFVDADERLTPELTAELCELFAEHSTPGVDGYYVGRMNYFMGRWIRHGGWYPNWNLRLFKRRLGRYEERIVHEHLILRGSVGHLRNPLKHDDYKGLERYFDRHNVYSSMEAVEVLKLLRKGPDRQIAATLTGSGPERHRMLKLAAYRYLPCRSLFKFFWMYIIQRGFMDGRAGFRYCVLQTFYEYQISLKLIELSRDPSSPIFLKYAAQAGLNAGKDG